jgi:hypothetical protein
MALRSVKSVFSSCAFMAFSARASLRRSSSRMAFWTCTNFSCEMVLPHQGHRSVVAAMHTLLEDHVPYLSLYVLLIP